MNASSRSISTTAWTSPPRCGALPCPSAEQVLAEERREDVRHAPEVRERRSRTRRAPEARLAEAVVRRAPLGVGEHLVRLGDVAEARGGVRLARDVGMQLTGQRPERALDLRVARAARNAEELVVVALGGRHQRLGVFVDVLDEPGELERGSAHGSDRLLVVHPQRADEPDCPERLSSGCRTSRRRGRRSAAPRRRPPARRERPAAAARAPRSGARVPRPAARGARRAASSPRTPRPRAPPTTRPAVPPTNTSGAGRRSHLEQRLADQREERALARRELRRLEPAPNRSRSEALTRRSVPRGTRPPRRSDRDRPARRAGRPASSLRRST